MDALQKNTTEKELTDLVRLLATHREFALMHVGFSFFINPARRNLVGTDEILFVLPEATFVASKAWCSEV